MARLLGPLFLVLAAVAPGQDRLRSRVDLVQVDVVVTDRTGRPVTTLQRAGRAVIVLDEGVRPAADYGGAGATYAVPLPRDLPAGNYVLRVHVRQGARTRVRELAFTIAPEA